MAARLRMCKRAFTKSEPLCSGAFQIVNDFLELGAIHKIRLVIHSRAADSPTTEVRPTEWASRSFSTSIARARCSRERTVPTGHFYGEAASS
ncbi:MAG: hypothetical protein WB559_01040 [Candidatus Acidiferrales bacterium]